MFIPTFSSKTLDDFANKEFLDNYKAVVSDLDYTLTLFDHKSGMQKVAQEHGEAVALFMNNVFDVCMQGGRENLSTWDRAEEYRNLLQDLSVVQKLSKEDVRKWCRVSWVILANEKLDLHLSWQDIENIRDTYWSAIHEGGVLYSGARKFVELLDSLHIPLIIMTSSDSVFRIDDDAIIYDPDFAREYKMRRMVERIKFVAGDKNQKRDIIIGDPVDKPSKAFTEIIEELLRKKIGDYSPSEVLVMGDSPRTDLEPFAQHGYTTLHVDRDYK